MTRAELRAARSEREPLSEPGGSRDGVAPCDGPRKSRSRLAPPHDFRGFVASFASAIAVAHGGRLAGECASMRHRVPSLSALFERLISRSTGATTVPEGGANLPAQPDPLPETLVTSGRGLDRFPAHYERGLRVKPGSRDLVVILAHGEKFAFFKYPFDHSVLFLRDKRWNYYCQYAGAMADGFVELLDEYRFERVVFVGVSKAAYGALLQSAMCARYMPSRSFRAIGFSAQTRLYPHNDRLVFPSYLGMMRRASTDERLRENLEKYGDLRKFVRTPNVSWTLVYCDGNEADAAEVEYVRAPNVRRIPLPFSFHGSVIPFTLDRTDASSVKREVERIYRDAQKDADLLTTLPSNQADLVRDIMAARWIPTLGDLVDDVLRTAV